jgi:hypothetical protein
MTKFAATVLFSCALASALETLIPEGNWFALLMLAASVAGLTAASFLKEY